MNRLNLSVNIEKSEFPSNNTVIIYRNYKYKIQFNGKTEIILEENAEPVLYMKKAGNKIRVSGLVFDILKNKGLSEENIIKEAWEMVYQISLLCLIEK